VAKDPNTHLSIYTDHLTDSIENLSYISSGSKSELYGQFGVLPFLSRNDTDNILFAQLVNIFIFLPFRKHTSVSVKGWHVTVEVVSFV